MLKGLKALASSGGADWGWRPKDMLPGSDRCGCAMASMLEKGSSMLLLCWGLLYACLSILGGRKTCGMCKSQLHACECCVVRVCVYL